MLFDSSLRKELPRSFGATLVVLVTGRHDHDADSHPGSSLRGNVNPSDVIMVMGFTVGGWASCRLFWD